MKISQQELEAGKISTGNLDATTKTAVDGMRNTIEYDMKKATLNRGDPNGAYQPEVFKYAIDNNIKIVDSMKDALQLRAAGAAVFTVREVDIMARSKIDLTTEFTMNILLNPDHGFVFIEPRELDTENIFKLRELYNRGVQWRKTVRETTTEEKRKVGDKAMLDALVKMDALMLPAWPGEVENGFPIELTKPECYSWSQWNNISSQTYVPEGF